MKTRIAVVLAALALTACAGESPRAWQRGTLASPEMAWEPDPLLAAYRDHAFVSKEQASGGAKAAGGGCGCNN